MECFRVADAAGARIGTRARMIERNCNFCDKLFSYYEGQNPRVHCSRECNRATVEGDKAVLRRKFWAGEIR
jgi:hypothetical protein